MFERGQQLLANSSQACHHDFFRSLATCDLAFGLWQALTDARENGLQKAHCFKPEAAKSRHAECFKVKPSIAAKAIVMTAWPSLRLRYGNALPLGRTKREDGRWWRQLPMDGRKGGLWAGDPLVFLSLRRPLRVRWWFLWRVQQRPALRRLGCGEVRKKCRCSLRCGPQKCPWAGGKTCIAVVWKEMTTVAAPATISGGVWTPSVVFWSRFMVEDSCPTEDPKHPRSTDDLSCVGSN